MKNILRWIAVPFAAIIGSLIVYWFVAIWIKGNQYGFEIYNGSKVGSLDNIILAIAAQAAWGVGFVYCGSVTAPSRKRICSVVLATLATILGIIAILAAFAIRGFHFIEFLHYCASIVGAIGVSRYILTSDEYADKDNTEAL